MSEPEVRPAVGAGDIEISLLDSEGNPERFVLKPSYQAARTISAQSGGLIGAIERVARLDIEATNQIIQLGIGKDQMPRGGMAVLSDRVWRTGLSDEEGGIAERCIAYLRVLMNGGRAPQTSGDGDGAKN
jgi:hypothetical protein